MKPTQIPQILYRKCAVPISESVQTYLTLRAFDYQSRPWYLALLTLQNGQKILDATSASGAAVSAIGHGNKDVTKPIVTQLDSHPGFYQTDIAQGFPCEFD